MRLVLVLPPSEISFTPTNDDGPYPFLLEVGTLRVAARAGRESGIGVGESPSIDVQLDNAGNHVASIIGSPLRVRATVYDGDTVFFTGIVANVRHGRTIQLTIES